MISSYLYNVIGFLLRNFFLFMGPIYIKIGQVCSYDYPILKELYTLQDDCGPLETSYFNYIKKKYNYLEIDEKYLASGSIAVVYKCKYNNNDCVIKIKRPNIEKKIHSNIKSLKFIVDNIFPYFIKLDNTLCNIKDRINKVISLYKIQTDFNNEINNWKIFSELYNDISCIIIPHLYEDMSNEEIILMEYKPGTSLLNNNEIIKNGNSYLHRINKNFLSLFLSSLINNVYHGDLHLGNFAVDTDGNIIIYDYGLCFDFNNDINNKDFLLDIVDNYVVKNKTEIIKIIIDKYCINSRIENNLKFKEKLFNEIYESKDYKYIIENNNIDFVKLFTLIKNVLYKHNVKINDETVKNELLLLPLISTFDFIFELFNKNNEKRLQIENIVDAYSGCFKINY